jgi:glutathione reductase (NADPH)
LTEQGPTLRWQALVDEREQLIDGLVDRHRQALDTSGVQRFVGTARFASSHEIDVDGQPVRGKAFVIATGGRPQRGRWPGAEGAMVSDGFFAAHKPPPSAIVVGGGYIAVECAGILGRLGIACTLVCRSKLLKAFDPDVAAGMAEALLRHNVRVLQNTQVLRQHQPQQAFGPSILTVRTADTEEHLEAHWIVTALGRQPNVEALKLERVGLKVAAGQRLSVDADQRTSVPHIFAVGDVTDGPQLTPVAIRAGRRVAHVLFDATGSGPPALDPDCVPTAVFGPEPLAAVGLTEAAAKKRFGADVACRTSRFVPLRQARLPEQQKVESVLKIVYRPSSRRVVGLHMLGADAPEIMQGFAAAMSAGLTTDALDATVALHPTQAEEFTLMGAW